MIEDHTRRAIRPGIVIFKWGEDGYRLRPADSVERLHTVEHSRWPSWEAAALSELRPVGEDCSTPVTRGFTSVEVLTSAVSQHNLARFGGKQCRNEDDCQHHSQVGDSASVDTQLSHGESFPPYSPGSRGLTGLT